MREAPIRQLVRAPRALRDFGVRTVTAVGLGAVLIAADLWPNLLAPGDGLVWAGVIAALAALCAIEFYKMMRTGRRKPNELFGVVAAAAMPIAVGIYASRALPSGASSAADLGSVGLTAVMGGLIIVALAWHIVFPQISASDTAITVFGALYTGFALAHLVLMRALDSGAELVIITLAGVWAMDVFAYLVGSAVGTHRLAPHISPKKSWEGFIAGAIATTIAWGVGWNFTAKALPLWVFLCIGVVAAIAALFGDLVESRIKREVQVKDSGRLLPGHGGFLDRFDSMIVVSIVAYYVLLFAGAR
ncbi:MAG TPA: phosphatidate cytidylyltransferase [Coriobacteriia bacterium]